MGRSIPVDHDDLSINRTLLSYTLFAVWIAAVVSMVIAMCGFTRRKESPESGETLEKTEETAAEDPASATDPSAPRETDRENAVSTDGSREGDDAWKGQELPLPPALRAQGQLKASMSCNKFDLPKSTSTRNLRTSLSMRKPSMAGIIHKNKDKFKRDDSVWMKTIILGEKCKVPAADDEEGDGAVIYSHKGNVVSAYHPKHPRTLTLSRNNSLELDASSSPNS